MSAAARRLAFALVLASCGPSEARGPAETRRAAGDFVAQGVGDRVRMRYRPGDRIEHEGVSARDARGRLVVHGTDRVAIGLVRVESDAVWLVAPDDSRLVPLVVGPITKGTTTRYPLDRDGARGSCSLAITEVERRRIVAGVAFEGCLEQHRRCSLEPGGALPRATTIDEDEVLCPGLGLVARSFRVEPPLPFEGVSSDERGELAGFLVAGTPVLPPSTSLADRLIVLPTDVAAACGGDLGPAELRSRADRPATRALPDLPTPPDATDADAFLAFERPTGRLTIEARAPGRGGLEDYRRAPRADGTVPDRLAFETARAQVRITGLDACADASRLEPLLRSLL